jgi:protein tyrosine/serine phosphatase
MPDPADAKDAAAAAATRPIDWGVALKLDGAPNLHRVTPLFYRSAQPLKAGFPALLRDLGIKTVVSLRAFHSDKKFSPGTDLKLVSVPINTWDIDRPDVVRALAEIEVASKRGAVLLHCQHGADRTGLITALYRMLHQGWTHEKALDEMRNGSFGYHAVWGNIPRFLRKVDVAKLRASVAAKVCEIETGKVCGKG